jgi:hypothetical protein
VILLTSCATIFQISCPTILQQDIIRPLDSLEAAKSRNYGIISDLQLGKAGLTRLLHDFF